MGRPGLRALVACGLAGVAAAGALVLPHVAAVVPSAAADSGSKATAARSLVVATDKGKVRGLSRVGYDAWLGIPYAAPPTGAARWQAPQPADAWTGVRNARRFGDRCVQGTGWDPGYETPKLSEDCLSLNVYAPESTRGGGRGLPVFVWIHGGGFTGGAGQDTDPQKFVRDGNVVYVTINYRLGALGFLNLPQLAGEGAGNYGLLDQQAALRWVQANIAAFGGDPRNVTIAGQSAGGSSVCDQLASPTAKGLFARAIIQSGGCSMLNPTAGQQASAAFVQQVGCASDADVAACLRGKSTAQILAAQKTAGVRPSYGGTAFPTDPGAAIAAGAFTRVPVMIGQVSNERSLFTFQNYDYLGKPLTADTFTALVRSTYGADADTILAEYPLSKYSSPGDAWSHLSSDAASLTRQKLYGQLAKYTPTWAYEFAESATPQFTSIFRLQQQGEPAKSFPFGATHVDELGYLWEYLGQTLPYTDDQLELSHQMIRYWSTFAANGDPNAPRVPAWPSYDPARDRQMSLKACDTDPAGHALPAACSKVTTSFSAEHRTAFWAGIGLS